MARPRSTYTAEFKLSAVKMITEQKLSVAEAARRLDVGENLLRAWRKVELPTKSGQCLAVGSVMRPLVLVRGDIPQ